jgi:hypothetical protein
VLFGLIAAMAAQVLAQSWGGYPNPNRIYANPLQSFVGIGTDNPQYQLHIAPPTSSSAYIALERAATDKEAGIVWRNPAANAFYMYLDNPSTGSDFLQIQAAGLAGEDDNYPRIRIPRSTKDIQFALSGGKVAIGHPSPIGRLDVMNGSSRMVVASSAHGLGDGVFYLNGAAGRALGVNTTSEGLVTEVGINLAINGETGNERYAVTGAKKSPHIRFNGENGSISLYGEGGSGGNYRTVNRNLGLAVNSAGNVGVGTEAPEARLHVAGDLKVSGAISVKTWTVAPDYVFEKEYKLASLAEVESFIGKNKHLPEVPSAKEFKKKGMDLAEMNFILLKKIEELTLHAIAQEKRSNEQERKIAHLEGIIKKGMKKDGND